MKFYNHKLLKETSDEEYVGQSPFINYEKYDKITTLKCNISLSAAVHSDWSMDTNGGILHGKMLDWKALMFYLRELTELN